MLKRLIKSLIVRLNNAACSFFAIRILLSQRRKATIEKQIELIKKSTDEELVKAFIDETRVKKPITKVKILIYFGIVIGIAAIGGYNIAPLLVIFKSMVGV